MTDILTVKALTDTLDEYGPRWHVRLVGDCLLIRDHLIPIPTGGPAPVLPKNWRKRTKILLHDERKFGSAMGEDWDVSKFEKMRKP